MRIKERTVNGVIWSGLGTVGCGIIGLGVTMVMSRHLSPADFGLIEIILSFVLISDAMVDFGFSQAIIREKTINKNELSALFTVNLIIALIIYVIFYIATPSIMSYYHTEASSWIVMRVLSLKILFDACSVIQVAERTRVMHFKEISIISFISMIIAGSVSIVSIFWDAGIWAIVIYYITIAMVKAILLNASSANRLALNFNFSIIRRFIKFGGTLMTIKIIDKIITSVESLLVGRVYSKSDLGYFSQARKFDTMVIQSMLGVVQKVSYPALSSVSDDDKLKTGYSQIMQISLWTIMPIALFSLFNAKLFMEVIFGPQWIASSTYFRLFSIYSLIIPLYFICWNIFLVKGDIKRLFKIATFKQVLRLIVILFTAYFSLKVFTIGIVAVMAITSLIYMYFSCKLINYSLPELFKDNFSTMVCALISIAVSWFIGIILNNYISISVTLIFVIEIVISIAVYFLLSRIVGNRAYSLLMVIGKEQIHKLHNRI